MDLTDHLRVGENTLTIVLYHNLRNRLGPHHHPDGEPVFVNPESFRPEGFVPWIESLEAGQPVPAWRDAYCVVEFGLFAWP